MARNRRLAAVAIFISGFVVFFLARRGRSAEQADLVLRNGRIVTMDAKTPEGQAVAVRAGRIVAVGTDKEIVRYVGKATEVVDLKGCLAIPGFIESHGHFTGLGKSKTILDLTTARSWDDIVAMAGEAAKKAQPGEWILGRGWHQDKWDRIPEPNVDGLPLHDALSRATPDNPVYLTHASGHSALANAKAMEIAGVTAKIKNPDGGEVTPGQERESDRRLPRDRPGPRRPGRQGRGAEADRRGTGGPGPGRDRPRRKGMPGPRHHDVPRRGGLLRDGRPLQEAGGGRRAGCPALRDAERGQRGAPEEGPGLSDARRGGRSPHRSGGQAPTSTAPWGPTAPGSSSLTPTSRRRPASTRIRSRSSARRRSSRSKTISSWASTPSATGPTGKRSTFTRRRSGRIPPRPAFAGVSSMRSI